MKYHNWSKKLWFLRDSCTKIVQFLLTHPCKLCLEPVSGRALLCPLCEMHLPFLSHACIQCSLPLGDNMGVLTLCGKCQNTPPSYAYSHCIFIYTAPVSVWIKEFKDMRQIVWAQLFAKYFWQYAPQTLANCEHICIIPSSRSKLLRRGFNPMQLIAQRLKQQFNVQIHADVFVTYGAKEQRLLTAKQRKVNLNKSLHLKQPEIKISGRWLILEDVITTGATVERAAWLLKQQGAQEVGVCALARVL